jgi:hypothetical protein
MPLKPPLLEVLDPIHGATVTSRRYTFSGITDPGCAVIVGGKYAATVDDDGTWELELVLEPGQNSTTFVAFDPETGLETSQAIRVYYAERLELRPDGLRAVGFGQDETSTMEILTGLIGPPVFDSTCNDSWHCSGAGYGLCRYIRTVRWPEEGLSIVIADCEGNADEPETPRLISWSARRGESPDGSDTATLHTPEGIAPGSTVSEMQAAYGDRFAVGYDECGGGLYFIVHSPVLDHPEQRMYGYLPTPPGFELPDDYYTDPSQYDLTPDPSTEIPGIAAGVAQSC